MIAVLWTSGPASSLTLYMMLFTFLIVGFVFAPQEWKRDRRALVGLALLVIGLVGKAAYAAVVSPGVCDRAWGWLVIECWL